MKQKRNYVLIAERALGHELPEGAIVHHIDSDRTNHINSNLVVLQSAREHMALHKRLRTLRAGGNPFTQQICVTCRVVKDFTDFTPRPFKSNCSGRANRCRPCTAKGMHALLCRRAGREHRKLTAAERSEVSRCNTNARWAAVRKAEATHAY